MKRVYCTFRKNYGWRVAFVVSYPPNLLSSKRASVSRFLPEPELSLLVDDSVHVRIGQYCNPRKLLGV